MGSAWENPVLPILNARYNPAHGERSIIYGQWLNFFLLEKNLSRRPFRAASPFATLLRPEGVVFFSPPLGRI